MTVSAPAIVVLVLVVGPGTAGFTSCVVCDCAEKDLGVAGGCGFGLAVDVPAAVVLPRGDAGAWCDKFERLFVCGF